jgi:predicted AlkP superfamily pyrophosphatase or phosphodiesterase
MGKVILILSDALRYDTAVNGMGYLGHLVEIKKASLYKVIGELPTMSRPMYETVHTGLPSSVHGIVSNRVVRPSRYPNIFRLAVEAGKTTAASAHSWFSELYNRVPYNFIKDREIDDPALPIQHGRFYSQDAYPDLEVFETAAVLVDKFNPDYLLIHPMGMDDIGETFGANSSQYRNNAIRQDMWLAPLIAEWIEMDYNILVTGDHGINDDKLHGGTTPEVREVPLFLIRAGTPGEGKKETPISQLQMAPTICNLLKIPIPETMKSPPVA